MFRAARGTKDIQPQEQKYWRYVEGKAADLGRRHGFKRIDTPTFESSDLFTRSVGEGTDIMDKETYTFLDRGGDSLTLRPEGTAPVCRAYLEHGMHSLPQPVRLYYFCPVFRYDRPQAGRYRQHHQFGVEALGDGDPIMDAEIVQIGWTLMSDLGLKDLSLVLNTIGDTKCRPGYIEELKAYYSGHYNRLCSDCKQRLEHNPLRLLDCKKESCQPLQEEAPASADHLCDECQEHWDQMRRYMKVMDIPYTVDHRLVRGLDYYTRTVFEILPPEEGAQSTLLGGGRYDGLIEQLGGRPTPGVGFATGMERLILNVQRQEVPVPEEEGPRYFIATMEDKGAEEAVKLATRMREAGIGVIQGPRGRSLRGQMRNANSMGVSNVIIIGEEELATQTITRRDMIFAEQRSQDRGDFLKRVEEMSKANPEHVRLILEGSDAIKEWRQAHPTERLHLRGADFVGINLAGVNLRGADMSEADLRRADLRGADLSGAHFFRTDLSYSSLHQANLSRAILLYANLSGADLSEADFNAALFGHTGLSGLNLGEAIGLESAQHAFPSTIGIDALLRSEANLPIAFLQSAGVPEAILSKLPELIGEVRYKSCFISYGEPDKAFAIRLQRDLAIRGVNSWVYSADYTPGESTWQEIRTQLAQTESVIILCSAHSLLRDAVLKEIEVYLDEAPEELIPASLDKTWKADGFPVKRGARDLKPFLLERNYANFEEGSDYEKELNKLLKALERRQG